MMVRRCVLSATLAFVVELLASLGAQADEQDGLGHLTGTNTPLWKNDRISFIGDSITMQGGFIRLMREAVGRSDHTNGLRFSSSSMDSTAGAWTRLSEGWHRRANKPLLDAAQEGQAQPWS